MKETLLERCQREARDFAENAVFPVSPKLGNVLNEIEIKRMDDEIYKVIDQIIANTLKQAAEALSGLMWTVQATDDAHRFYQVRDHNLALTDAQKLIRGELDVDV